MASILVRCTGGTDIPADALAGWLAELEVADRQVAHPEPGLAEILGDMRLLALRPAVFVPYGLADARSRDADAGSHATAVRSGGA